MKKFASVLLGMTLAFGAVSMVSAFQEDKMEKKEKKGKKGKGKMDEKKMEEKKPA